MAASKLGFLDGPEGKIFHFLQAYWYRFLVDAKIYECEKKGIKMEQQGALEAIPSNRGGGAALKIKFCPNLTFVSTGRAVLA